MLWGRRPGAKLYVAGSLRDGQQYIGLTQWNPLSAANWLPTPAPLSLPADC